MSSFVARTNAGGNAGWINSKAPLAPHKDSYAFAMHDNWDNQGAVALTPDVVTLANSLITGFASTQHLVEIGPGRDGSLSLVWDDSAGNYVYLDVGPNDTIHLFYNVIQLPRWEGVSNARDPRIIGEMVRAFAFLGPAAQAVYRFVPSAANSNFAPQRIWAHA